jgi:hypothetical protein
MTPEEATDVLGEAGACNDPECWCKEKVAEARKVLEGTEWEPKP